MEQLQDRIAVITGASTGIGRSIAATLSRFAPCASSL